MSLSLCSVIYLIFLYFYFYAGLFFAAVFVYLISMHNKVLLDIHVRSMFKEKCTLTHHKSSICFAGGCDHPRF